MTLVTKYFGTRCNDGKYNSTADLNEDCKIDGKDISLVSKNFGKRC